MLKPNVTADDQWRDHRGQGFIHTGGIPSSPSAAFFLRATFDSSTLASSAQQKKNTSSITKSVAAVVPEPSSRTTMNPPADSVLMLARSNRCAGRKSGLELVLERVWRGRRIVLGGCQHRVSAIGTSSSAQSAHQTVGWYKDTTHHASRTSPGCGWRIRVPQPVPESNPMGCAECSDSAHPVPGTRVMAFEVFRVDQRVSSEVDFAGVRRRRGLSALASRTQLL